MDIRKLGSNPFVYKKRADNDDGSVTYRGAVLLAEGTWRDGASGVTVFYPAAVIERYYDNWVSDLYTLNHGDSPLDILGEISNRKFEDKSLIGDVTFHRGTQPSRDAEWLAEQGFVDGNSVEIATRDVWDEPRGVYRADFMEFQRASLVISPACSTCRLSACPLPEDEGQPESNREGDDMGEDCPEETEKELKAKAEELDKKLTEAESETKELQEKSEKLSQEHDELKSLAEAKDKEISELKAKVEELKKEPVHQSLAGDTGTEGDPEYHSDIVIRDGQVYREV